MIIASNRLPAPSQHKARLTHTRLTITIQGKANLYYTRHMGEKGYCPAVAGIMQ